MARPSSIPQLALLLAPLVGLGIAAIVVSLAGERAGQAIAAPGPHVESATAPPADAEIGRARDGGRLLPEMPRSAARARIAPDGGILAPPDDETYACLQPALAIVREPACDQGRAYPRCRWQLPDAGDAAGLYGVWRNTTPEHRWARPGLISLVLAAAREYAARWPGERITIGDLDAAGPRHQTHDRGVDVDLYLAHAMIAANIGGGRYPDNYEGRPGELVALLRARVLDLARILGTCARGRLRIYYNDPAIVDAFGAWFAERGLVSDVGPPMMMHNALHRFHFHMTVAEDLEPLAVAAPARSE